MHTLRVPFVLALLAFSSSALAGSKVTICHATGSASNPYTQLEVSESAWSKGTGHGAHAGDVEATTWYEDMDDDGYGSTAGTVVACEQPLGYVDNAWDCDDWDPEVRPDALDVCDDVDNDCDGTVDNAGTLVSSVAGELVGIDLTDGSSTWTVDSTGWTTTMQGVAGSVESELVYSSNKAGEIYEHDLGSGSTSLVANVGAIKVCGMALTPTGEVYYLSRTYGTLNRLDPYTGTSSTVGSLGVSLATCGLTYSPEEDVFYVLDRFDVHTVDPDNGAVIDTVSTSGMVGASAGIAWSCEADTVLTQTFQGVFEVDLSTGAASRVHTYGDDSLTFVAD